MRPTTFSSYDFLRSGIPARVSAMMARRLTQEPGRLEAWTRRADSARARGDIAEALGALRRASVLAPERRDIAYAIAALQGDVSAVARPPGTAPAPVLCIDDAVPSPLLANLVDAAMRDESAYAADPVGRNRRIDRSYRQSFTKPLPAAVRRAYTVFLTRRIPTIARHLGVELGDGWRIWQKLTMARDGNFYRPHSDHSHRGRAINCVLYLCSEPRAFRYGDLAVYDTDPDTGDTATTFSLHTVRNNRLACFPSWAVHEVQKLELPGDAFAQARFAIVSHIETEPRPFQPSRRRPDPNPVARGRPGREDGGGA